MADLQFEDPRLAAIYDAVDEDRSDLQIYHSIVGEFGAQSVLDIGCGTGTFALLLADDGCEVIGVDPALASLDVARGKPGAERVQWIHGDAAALPPLEVDIATMTGNVAQAIEDPDDWSATLRAVHRALRPGGRLVFESRDPAFRGWEEWNRETSYRVVNVPGTGDVVVWVELVAVDLPLVTFTATYHFKSTGDVLQSTSTLRFRTQQEIERQLVAHGYLVDELRDAPDRPRREFVFIARRPC